MAAGKFTQGRAETIIEALRAGMTRTGAAELSGITRVALWQWLSRGEKAQRGGRYRDFYEAVLAAEAEAEQRHTANVERHAVDDPKLSTWWLERRRPDDYGRRERHEVTGAGGEPIRVELAWPQGPQPPT